MALQIVPAAALLLALQAPPPDTVTLVIAATTDVHGRLMSWNYERGVAAPLGLVRAATAVDSLRRVHGRDRVILLDAGDLLQGNVFAEHFAGRPGPGIHPIIDAMNRMGYDAATPGNHEYNFGIATFARLRRGARFPWVSANIAREPDWAPAFPEAVVLRRAGVRVAVTGVTTPGVMVWDRDKVRGRLRFGNAREAVVDAFGPLYDRDSADVYVLIAHMGLGGPSSYAEDADHPPENNAAAAIAALERLDVAILGHTHREIADTSVGAALVVQPGAYARSLAVAELTVARAGGRWRVVSRRGTLVPLDRVAPDTALAARFAAAHQAALRAAEAPVGSAAAPLPAERARLEDTPLVDFVNGVMRRASGAQLSATAAFDTRAGIPAGPVRLRDIAAIYPYENNTLRAVRISGADLRAYLEHAARYYRGVDAAGRPVVNDSVPGYNFDIVSGVEYELDLSQPVGRRVAQLLHQGRDVRATDSFTLAVNDYRQQGGGGFPAVAGAPVVFRTDSTIRDLLVAEFRRRGTIRPADYFERNWSLSPSASRSPLPAADSIVLRVLAINDLHGRISPRQEPWSNQRPVGGAAAIAGMMRRLEEECGCAVLRVDGGDMMQGTAVSNLTHGRATVDAANAMGFHASVIGNHEFDWTVDTLAARITQARFAWLAANIIELRSRRRPGWAEPWRMVEVGGRRVAVIGYASPATTTTTNPLYVAHLGFRGAAAIDSVIRVARAQGPDAVVLLAHDGAFCNEAAACEGAVVRLAQQLAVQPDLIVSGHTHSLVNTVVNGIPIVQARSGGTALGVVDLVRGAGGLTARVRIETVWADREAPDTAVARIVEGYERAADTLARRPVAELAERLHRDSVLGGMVAETFRRVAGADVGLMNAGGVRRNLEAGTATWGDVFEVLPFGNMVVRIAVNGSVLKRTLHHALTGGGDRRGHVVGARLTDTGGRAEAPDVVLADGRVVTDTGRYTIGTIDFLANGGSGYAMLRGQPATNLGVTDLDAFLRFLQSLPRPVRAWRPERSER